MAEVIGGGAGTITQGGRLNSAIQSTRKVPQWLKKTVSISADVAPLQALIKQLGNKGEVEGESYFHLETDMLPISVTLSGTHTSGVTTLNCASGHAARVAVGQELKNWRTTEIVRVTGVNTSADTLQVTRGHKGTTAASMTSAEILGIIGFSDTENNTSPEAISSEPTLKINYIQCFRQKIEISGRAQVQAVYGDDELNRIKKDAMEALMTQVERAYLHSNGVSSSNPTGTGGLQHWISSNISPLAGSALDELTFNTDIRNWMRRNFQVKDCVILASEAMAATLDSFMRETLRYSTDDTIAGVTASRYRTAFGEVRIVRHGLLSALGSDETAANLGPQGISFGINVKNVGERWMKGRNTQPRSNIQANDQDGFAWEYWCDKGFWLANEKSHCLWTGQAVPA